MSANVQRVCNIFRKMEGMPALVFPIYLRTSDKEPNEMIVSSLQSDDQH